jgi:hypothetical protein
MLHIPQESPERLRELATWYRGYASHAGSTWVWEARLQTAEALERAAELREASPKDRPMTARRATRSPASDAAEVRRLEKMRAGIVPDATAAGAAGVRLIPGI